MSIQVFPPYTGLIPLDAYLEVGFLGHQNVPCEFLEGFMLFPLVSLHVCIYDLQLCARPLSHTLTSTNFYFFDMVLTMVLFAAPL